MVLERRPEGAVSHEVRRRGCPDFSDEETCPERFADLPGVTLASCQVVGQKLRTQGCLISEPVSLTL